MGSLYTNDDVRMAGFSHDFYEPTTLPQKKLNFTTSIRSCKDVINLNSYIKQGGMEYDSAILFLPYHLMFSIRH